MFFIPNVIVVLDIKRSPFSLCALNNESVQISAWGIDKGFHSYSSKVCSYENLDDTFIGIYNIAIHKLLEYYSSKVIIVKGIIPKGAEYYINEYGECVSNKIILTKVRKHS